MKRATNFLNSGSSESIRLSRQNNKFMYLRKGIFKAFLAIFLIGFSAQINAQKVRFGFIGNSITIGTGLNSPETECYPSQIAVLLNQKYGDTCEVKNFAVSGRTMLKHGDFPIWNEISFVNALNYAPNILFLMLGTNDSKPQNWDSYKDEFFADYKSMLDTFLWRNPHVKFILCLPPPAFDVVWGIRDSVISNGVIPVVDSIAKLYNAVVVDFNTPLKDSVYLFPDKIHPNAKGAKVLAKIAFDTIISSDIVHKAETKYTFVTSLTTVPAGDLRKGDTLKLSYTTINAKKVYCNGKEVELNGTVLLPLYQNTRIVIRAVGDFNEDSLIRNQIVYEPTLTRMVITPSKTRLYKGDTVTIRAVFYDQNNVLMKDTVIPLTWSIQQGKGKFINQGDNKADFVIDSIGNMIIIATAENKVSDDLKIIVKSGNAVENKLINSFECYPNPSNQFLQIKLGNQTVQNIKIKIFTIEGKLLCHKNIAVLSADQVVNINISNFKAGTYICNIETENSKVSEKFVVRH
jgi:lysophospholipase L1-like esterase